MPQALNVWYYMKLLIEGMSFVKFEFLVIYNCICNNFEIDRV